MRIVAGLYRGRPLAVPEGADVRPTSDRAREAVFNILAHTYSPDVFSLAGVRVLDMCAGTGALGLEALSRGASHVTFVERSSPALAVLADNMRALKVGDAAKVLKTDATHLPRAPIPCGLIFLDPPYADGIVAAALTSAATAGWIGDGAVVVVETANTDTPVWPQGFTPDDRRVYGKAAISFLRYHKD
ncbi:MAG: 16S rRNA (guanine(966)-N(2))-methyltransferase RsmD [Rhodospirillaceae bacterium]|nr:16S rRNA (guanine(966)-N(2))-methyltransferase RsmD [Rhodospirillaceae bacterium]